MSETFTLCLATSASVESLEDWLAGAAPRDQAIYASGVDFPRDSAAAVLVRRWESEGLVSLVQERDKGDRRRTNWIVQRRGVGVPSEPAALAGADSHRTPRTREQLAALYDLLVEQAQQRRRCPSLSQLARALEIGSAGEAGRVVNQSARQRARYLLDLLVTDGRVRLGDADAQGQRAITIVREKARG